ncbi:MAG: alpha/beta fold hydrolase [Actinobacteria bacterium]|nr:alpha/beta fold hydrolase [Actinomycetota bacterium]
MSTTSLTGFEERFADVKAVRLRYFVGGAGPPLVLVHGLTGAASNWAELAPRLARTRRVLVPDLPGHGGSAPLPAAPNLDAYAERVHALAQREAMLPAPLVGHSLGGLVALRLALRHPGDVTGVVLAAAAGIASTTRSAEFWISLFGLVRPGRLVAPFRERIARYPALRRAVFTRWELSDPASLSARSVEGFLAGPPLHTDVVSAGQVLVRDDPRLDLEGVRCSCLVLWGARDRQVPIDDAFEYARRLRAPLRTIADCGHLLIGERPEACADAIVSFLHWIREVDEAPVEPEPLG